MVPVINITGSVSVISGQSYTYNSTITNGGGSPSYQWQDSTTTHNWQNIAGATSSSILYSPTATGNKLRCALTSSASCISPTSVNSNTLVFTVSAVTAVPTVNYSDLGIRYYPNPVSESLTIDSLKLSDRWQSFQVTDINGKIIFTTTGISGKTKLIVVTRQLPNGTYIGMLRRKQGSSTSIRFVKLFN